MPNSFWLVMFIAGFLIWAIPQWFNNQNEQDKIEDEEPIKVQFYGGPLDGIAEQVPRPSDFYIAPYLPRTDEGEVDLSEAKIKGQVGDKVLFEPNLAYYQAITTDSFFYVRDISQNEMIKLHSESGWRPHPKKSDDDTD